MLPLDPGFDAAVWNIARALMPDRWIVRHEEVFNLQELQDLIRATGKIVVSDQFSDQTIFADAATNCAFRAWHDWCHNALNAPFSPAGEAQVAKLQKVHLATLGHSPARYQDFCDLVDAEVNGQTAYATVFRSFVADQRAFDLAYIRAMRDPAGE